MFPRDDVLLISSHQYVLGDEEEGETLTSLKSSYLILQFSQYPGFLGSLLGAGALTFKPASTLVLLLNLPGNIPFDSPPLPIETILRSSIASRLSGMPERPPGTSAPDRVEEAMLDVIVCELPDAAM